MRGFETQQTGMFSYVSLDERVPSDHPLRRMQALVNGILASMTRKAWQRVWAKRHL